jgi:hypothetical protein
VQAHLLHMIQIGRVRRKVLVVNSLEEGHSTARIAER